MANRAVVPGEDAVVVEIEIAAPPNRVFEALTDARQLARWWNSPICETTSWKMDPRPGGKWSFETSPASQSINGVNEFKCQGEILDYVPGRLLTHTWIANWSDQPESVTVVRWELTAIPTGTRVKVTHSGLATQPVVREAYRGGWPGVIANLKKFVEQ
jgi:uncharacterized protein YndB with AHSA1/START domain